MLKPSQLGVAFLCALKRQGVKNATPGCNGLIQAFSEFQHSYGYKLHDYKNKPGVMARLFQLLRRLVFRASEV